MKIWNSRLCALFACCGIAACSQATEPSQSQYAPVTKADTSGVHFPLHYAVAYNFRGSKDGAYPSAGVVADGGKLYGTTAEGGSYGLGTVFSFNTATLHEKVLYSFGYGTDGSTPVAGLIDVGGALYGTTESGGTYGGGTVFSITTGGTEKVLHSFGGGADGLDPEGRLIAIKGALYGTTAAGGANTCGSTTCGTVFSIVHGTETVLHSFKGGSDGDYPCAGLADVGGKLYGTTFNDGRAGGGTAFSITTSGSEKVLHAFGGGGDGNHPCAALTNLGGKLYGTTAYGGTYACAGSQGCGTAFMMTTAGREQIVHDFGKPGDGAFPFAPVTGYYGAIYGTTTSGGVYSCYPSTPCGTVFTLSASGEQVVHSFGAGKDGSDPVAGLDYKYGGLFGTTREGGTFGDGTLFVVQ